MRKISSILCAAVLAALVGVARAQDAPAEPSPEDLKPKVDVTESDERDEATADVAGDEKVILQTQSFWRMRTVRETSELITPDGRIVHGRVSFSGMNSTDIYGWFRVNLDAKQLPADKWVISETDKEQVVTLPGDTPADWMASGFDDSAWARVRGPMFSSQFGIDDQWKLILMRGRFDVPNPAKAGDLSLTVSFRGGVVVYLNGREVSRAFMPAGDLTLRTPAEPYPSETFFTPEGYILPWSAQATRGARAAMGDEIHKRVASRTRRVSALKIPASMLKEGVNVLAIGIYRAPTPAAFYASRPEGKNAIHASLFWTRLGLVGVKLSAGGDAAVKPNIGPSSEGGFRLWNNSVAQKVFPSDYPDPFADLKPITISAARNGLFAGQVVVGDTRPIANLKVEVSDLAGPGMIPASAVQVRYARLDGIDGSFDSLEEFAPAEVKVNGQGRAIQPLWLTVAVPAGAKPGDYTGKITVRADGVGPVAVELKVRVIDWALPAAGQFAASMDIIQSPESVAMAYNVPLWSDRHFELLDKTFTLLGQLATRSLYITAIRRTHLGNEHAMVRWVRDDEGELHPDFTIVEKYLDVALKRLGRINSVILYAWEPPESQGHAGGAGKAGRTYDKPILYSLYDPETGEYSTRTGPMWGTPEAKEFWKKFSDGVVPVLAKRGLKDAMLFGLVGDARPTRQAMDDVSNGVPGVRWAMHSHYFSDKWQGYDIGLRVALWGIRCSMLDPEFGYSFGWSNPVWLAYYPREMSLASTLTEHRAKIEAWVGARRSGGEKIVTGDGPRGLGRLGADFWLVIKDNRGRARATLAGIYPEAAWGQLNLNFGVPRLLAPGRDEPIATVRSEAFREALQEVEARAFIEKALLDPAGPGLLGQELVDRCRRTLDERIRVANRSATYHGAGAAEAWFISSGWRERAELLFELAAQVRTKYGGREPQPKIDAPSDK